MNLKLKEKVLNRLNVPTMVKGVRTTVKKHSPEIIMGIGIAGMITTTVLAVKVTPKAILLIEREKERRSVDKLKPIEVIKSAWKCYIPSVVLGSLSIGCVIGAGSVHSRRNATLAAAYSLSESALKEYREKVVEVFGDKKEQTVRDAIAKDKVENNPVGRREIVITQDGDALCYEVISGRYFKSDISKLKKAENVINKTMLNEMAVSLNDLYYEIGLNGTSIGDKLGWNMEMGFVELNFSSQLTDDGTPCLVIDYRTAPTYDF